MIGDTLDGADIRYAAQQTLETWMPSVISELARRKDALRGLTNSFTEWAVPPRAYTRLPQEDIVDLAVDQSPACFVTSTGIQDAERDSDGIYSGLVTVDAYVFVRGQTWETTSDLVALYTRAMSLCLAQHDWGLEGGRKPKYVSEGWAEIVPPEQGRSIGGGAVRFTMRVSGLLDDSAGPLVPPEPPEYVDEDQVLADDVLVSVDAMED